MVRPDQVSFGVLVNAVPRDAGRRLRSTVCGVREKRSDGKLPAHVITYLTLALSLFPDDDYTEVATETANDQLKTHLRGPGRVLRSRLPDLVVQEIWAYLIVHPRSAR